MGIERPFSLGGKLKAIELAKLQHGKHYDGGGLFLNVEPSGSRSWILRTMVCGKRREIGLGSLATRSLASAREEAAKLRAAARRGEDIIEQRRVENRGNSIPTFETVATTVHEGLSETFDDTH